MKRLRNWMLAATLICGASMFTSCSNNDNPAPFNGGMAMIVKDGNMEYFQQIEASFRSECRQKGILAEYFSTHSEFGYEEQIEAVKELERRAKGGLKGIIYAPCKGQNGEIADAEVAALAKELNIPVIILDSHVNANSPLAECPFIGTDSKTSGKLMAEKVPETKIAAFTLKNTPGLERAEAFKEQKPDTEIFDVTADELKDAVEAVLDQYDTFVIFNGSATNAVLGLLKEKNKSVYTFDVYESSLKELVDENSCLKGIMAQNSFEMSTKAVNAVLNNDKNDQLITPIYITKDNLTDPSVKPFLDFYQR